MTKLKRYPSKTSQISHPFEDQVFKAKNILNNKYREYFSFYYSKEIDLILDDLRSRALIDFHE